MNVVALYCRVSTTEQAREGYSLGEQEKRLRMYAEAHGWIIGGVYTDGGYSGAKLERPNLQRLIADAQNHRINKVLVFKLDRLSRSQKDTLYLIEDVFLKNGVDFVSMSETLDTSTPFGIAMIGILSVFAQLERETIKERMEIGRDAAIQSGRWHGVTTPPPFGFKNENGKIAVDEYEASLVRRVYDLYIQGNTKREISRIMENTAPARNTPWEISRVMRILKNPVYIGKQRWKGKIYDCDDIQPIIDEETWNIVQYKREQYDRKEKPQTPHKHKYLLGGMIFCAKCGRRYCGSKSNSRSGNYYYYKCAGKSAYGNAEGQCPSKSVYVSDLDDMVISEIRKVSADRTLINAPDPRRENQTADRIQAIKKRLSDIQTQQARLIDLYAINSIDKSILLTRSESLTTERTKLETELTTVTQSVKRPTTFNADLDIFDQLINSSTDKMNLYPIIHSLIESITIDDVSIQIKWSI